MSCWKDTCWPRPSLLPRSQCSWSQWLQANYMVSQDIEWNTLFKALQRHVLINSPCCSETNAHGHSTCRQLKHSVEAFTKTISTGSSHSGCMHNHAVNQSICWTTFKWSTGVQDSWADSSANRTTQLQVRVTSCLACHGSCLLLCGQRHVAAASHNSARLCLESCQSVSSDHCKVVCRIQQSLTEHPYGLRKSMQKSGTMIIGKKYYMQKVTVYKGGRLTYIFACIYIYVYVCIYVCPWVIAVVCMYV